MKKVKLSELEIDLEALQELVSYLKYVIEFIIVAIIAYLIAISIKDSLAGFQQISPLAAVAIQWVSFFLILLIYYRLLRANIELVVNR